MGGSRCSVAGDVRAATPSGGSLSADAPVKLWEAPGGLRVISSQFCLVGCWFCCQFAMS